MLAALTAAVFGVSAARAQDCAQTIADGVGCCDDLCSDCSDCCDSGGTFVFEVEALLFKYHRADGVRAGSFNNVPPATTDDVRFDNEITPRITLGYITDSGLGFRARWWEFDHSGDPVFPGTGVAMDVNTYTIDFELFERIHLNDCWTIELSAGVRYNDFEETMVDPIPAAARRNTFEGWGGVVGFEATRTLGRWGGLYARVRGSMLNDDREVRNVRAGDDQNANLRDVTVGTTELALGYEYNRTLQSGTLLVARVGYEWQNWYNYSSSFTPVTTTPPGNPPADFAGPSDVGFSGLTFMVGFER